VASNAPFTFPLHFQKLLQIVFSYLSFELGPVAPCGPGGRHVLRRLGTTEAGGLEGPEPSLHSSLCGAHTLCHSEPRTVYIFNPALGSPPLWEWVHLKKGFRSFYLFLLFLRFGVSKSALFAFVPLSKMLQIDWDKRISKVPKRVSVFIILSSVGFTHTAFFVVVRNSLIKCVKEKSMHLSHVIKWR